MSMLPTNKFTNGFQIQYCILYNKNQTDRDDPNVFLLLMFIETADFLDLKTALRSHIKTLCICDFILL